MPATNKFARTLENNPYLLTRNSYLNFLRCLRAQYPRYGLRRILKTGFQLWKEFSPEQRNLFKQEHFLSRKAHWRTRKVPRRRLPRYYRYKRSLSVEQTRKRRRKNYKRLSKYKRCKFPGRFNK